MTMTDVKMVRRHQRICQIGFCAGDRLPQRTPMRQISGNRRGKGASRSMSVARGDSRGRENLFPCRGAKQILRDRSLAMSSLDQNRTGPFCQKRFTQCLHLLLIRSDRLPREMSRLGEVGCDQGSNRQEISLDRRDQIGRRQRIPARRRQNRIENDEGWRMPGETIGDGARDLGRRQHADFDRCDAAIIENCLDLRGYEIRRRHMKTTHTLRILDGERGQDRHPMASKRPKGFEIGLDSSASTRVRTRYA